MLCFILKCVYLRLREKERVKREVGGEGRRTGNERKRGEEERD